MGYSWGGVEREHFRFADSHVTGAYKSAGSPDARRPDLDPSRSGVVELRTRKFGGIVCLADEDSHDAADTTSAGQELWTTDGTTEGTVRAAEIHAGLSRSHAAVSHLAVFDDALFFSATDGRHGAELHRFVAELRLGAILNVIFFFLEFSRVSGEGLIESVL